MCALREEESVVEEEESVSTAEEYYESSEEESESRELSLPEVEAFIERSELWERMALGEIAVDKGSEMHRQIAARLPTITTTPARRTARRRRRK